MPGSSLILLAGPPPNPLPFAVGAGEGSPVKLTGSDLIDGAGRLRGRVADRLLLRGGVSSRMMTVGSDFMVFGRAGDSTGSFLIATLAEPSFDLSSSSDRAVFFEFPGRR